MATNPTVGTPTLLTVTGLSTLASANYVESAIYTFNSANRAVGFVVQIEAATTSTPSGRKRLLVFARDSLDNSAFRSGPSSGTSATDEEDLAFLGVLPMNSATTTHRVFIEGSRILGYVPPHMRIVVKNDLGVALTSGAVYIAEITA